MIKRVALLFLALAFSVAGLAPTAVALEMKAAPVCATRGEESCDCCHPNSTPARATSCGLRCTTALPVATRVPTAGWRVQAETIFSGTSAPGIGAATFAVSPAPRRFPGVRFAGDDPRCFQPNLPNAPPLADHATVSQG